MSGWETLTGNTLYLVLFLIGCVLIGFLLPALLIFFFCCRQRRRRGYMPVVNPVVASRNTLSLQVPDTRVMSGDEVALAGRYLVHNSRNYAIVRELPQIGTRREKAAMVIQHKGSGALFLLESMPTVKSLAPHRKETERLLASFAHPNVLPTVEVECHATKKILIVARALCPQGSLADIPREIADPLAPAAEKYRSRHAPVAEAQIAEWGRHILEGVVYLNAAGLPFVGLSLGNVVVENGVARLTGYENIFTGAVPRMRHFTGMVDSPRADVLAFALMLFDLAAGYELRSGAIGPNDFPAEFPRSVRKIIEAIVSPKIGEAPNATQLLALPFFQRVTLKYRTNIPPPRVSPLAQRAVEYAMSVEREDPGDAPGSP